VRNCATGSDGDSIRNVTRPDEWFVDLLGERARIATVSGTALAAITLIVARFNAISEGLSKARKQHAPIFERMDNGTVLQSRGARGF
jgi:hypothetical protein